MSTEEPGGVLREADRLVYGSRAGDYGPPELIYARVGRIWGAILGVPDIPPATVCLMLAGMKIGRHAERPKRDNLTDAAGYCETVAMCEDAGSVANGNAAEPEKPPGAMYRRRGGKWVCK